MQRELKATLRKAGVFRQEADHRPDYASTSIWSGTKPVHIKEEIGKCLFVCLFVTVLLKNPHHSPSMHCDKFNIFTQKIGFGKM